MLPPSSVVELIKADSSTPIWQNRIGTRYRIGYYSPKCGLDTVWLVDNDGVYRETAERKSLLKYFKIIRLSEETDYFGKKKPALGKVTKL